MLELNVMSLNVRYMYAKDGENGWEQRRDILFEVVHRHGPDVLATQEAWFPQIEQIGQAFPEYSMVGAGRDDGARGGEFCALFFHRDRFQPAAQGTFWLSNTPDVPGSRHETCSLPRICTWVRLIERSGEAFTVYNVHLDHQSQAAREYSVRLLLTTIRNRQNTDPLLLMGDFNMEENNPTFNELTTTSLALQDTYRIAQPSAGECGTFHGFNGTRYGDKIDFIFASPEFEVLEAQILHDNREGRYPSDHFPITARVRIP